MRYGAVDVLHGVDLTARRGEVLALLGPNGAGKTTTIEILEGFRLPSAGTVRVLGVDPARGDERWRARLGVVLQSWRDHGKWRVRELLAHLGDFYAPYATDRIPRPWPVDELLETRRAERARRQPGGRGSPVASAAGSTWRSASSAGRNCCSWTSRLSASTRPPGASSTSWCTAWPTWTRPRSC